MKQEGFVLLTVVFMFMMLSLLALGLLDEACFSHEIYANVAANIHRAKDAKHV